MNDTTPMPQILFIEPQFVLRRTVVTVARELRVGELHEAASTGAALLLLVARSFDGIVLDTEDGDATSRLLSRLRSGGFASPADVPVLALSEADDDAPIDERLASLAIDGIIRKPFKVGALLERIGRMKRVNRPIERTGR